MKPRRRTPIDVRFWAKVDKNGLVPEHRPELGPCWIWTATLDGRYGTISLGARSEPKVKAHRLCYELLVGPVPDGLELDHLCRVQACVNPAHLEPVTHAENNRRGRSYWREKTHCPAGHPYDDENTVWYTLPNGRLGRRCRVCARINGRESSRRYRATKALKALVGEAS